jgi:hypothetical protein
LCWTAILADEATVKSRVNPLPAVSVIEFEELVMPIIKSLAFNAATPAARAGALAPPVVFEAVPGYPAALSQTVKVAAGSSAPLIAMTSALAAVGVPVKVMVIVTAERVPEAILCHSSKSIRLPEG